MKTLACHRSGHASAGRRQNRVYAFGPAAAAVAIVAGMRY